MSTGKEKQSDKIISVPSSASFGECSSACTSQSGLSSPGAQPHAEHFPHTVALLQRRKQQQSLSPEVGDRDEGTEAADEESPDKQRRHVGASTRKHHHHHHHRQAILARAQERLEAAKQRREALLEERHQQFMLAEQQRQRKVALQREMRREAFARFMGRAPDLLDHLTNAGLALPPQGSELDSNVVQQILMADPRVCAKCTKAQQEQQQREGQEEQVPAPALLERICPITKKPHRRQLVVWAEQFLKLVGETRVNLVPRRDVVGEAALAVAATKARRGISINPQIFILSYFNASIPQDSPDFDELVCGSAHQLVETLEQLKEAIGATASSPTLSTPIHASPDTVEAEIKSLLLTFARVWRQYARLSQEELSSSERDAAVIELIESTIAAAETVERQKGQLSRSSEFVIGERELIAEGLERYAAALRQRIQSLGGESAVALLEEKLQPLRSATETPPPENVEEFSETEDRSVERERELSSPVHLTAPVLGYEATSGSETDLPSSKTTHEVRHRHRRREPMGPPLPPRWFVDEHGVSRPPSKTDEQREQYHVMEHRARTAHEVRLPLFKATSQGYVDELAEAKKQLYTALDENLWASFKQELNSTPPNVARVPVMLRLVCERIVEALPRRLQPRVNQELRDALDWDLLRYRIADPKHLIDTMNYLVSKVNSYGAPAREEDVKSKAEAIATRLLSLATESLGDVVVDMFRFLLGAVGQMREDLVQFQLTVMSSEIAQKAPEYQREFTSTCLPSVEDWSSTIDWLRFSADQLGVALPLPPSSAAGSPPSAAAEGLDLFQLQQVVTKGLLSLLASANTSSDTRWKHFPQEVLHFDKKHIFTAANMTQLFTLRLMVATTVQLMLAQRRLSANLGGFLGELDRSIVEWLSTSQTQRPQQPRGSAVGSLRHAQQQEQKSKKHVTLEDLKDRLLEEVNMFLAEAAENAKSATGTNCSSSATTAATVHAGASGGAPGLGRFAAAQHRAPPPPNTAPLSETDCMVLRNVIDKMVDTTSAEYCAFEKRVVAAFNHVVGEGIKRASGEAPSTSSSPASPAPPTATVAIKGGATPSPSGSAPIVATDPFRAFANNEVLLNEVKGTAQDLLTLCMYHWETYRPFYEELAPQLYASPSTEEGEE